MKVGLILECGPMGADVHVCEGLIKMLDPTIELETVTLSNKPNLIDNCGNAAVELLASGCDRIVVVWDLYPAWRPHGIRPCRYLDRTEILAKLDGAHVGDSCFLVCIEEEIEAWLLADERAMNGVLSTPAHPTNIRRSRHRGIVRNPKQRLMQIFQTQGRHPYNDSVHAKQIVDALPDLQRLRRIESFRRFALKAADTEL